jgi:predicted glycoside hydrolase/deacetylase ChbG (UPF0249 family)
MQGPSVAERLGHGPQARLLIVTCDDLGSSHSANVASHRAMVYGAATGATLMVPCPWAREAARMFTGMPVGVHLTLTSEYRAYRWRGLTHGASLHDPDGFLPATTADAARSVTAADARAECRAQIDAALSWGVDVTHLDAHMDVVESRADLYEVYLDLAAAFGVPVRLLARDATRRQDIPSRARVAARGLLCNEHIVYPWPRRTRDVFLEEVPRLRPGVTEIFAHPVLDGEELRAYDTRHADLRAHDAACLTDPAIMDLLDRHGITRISYRDLRDVQRAG